MKAFKIKTLLLTRIILFLILITGIHAYAQDKKSGKDDKLEKIIANLLSNAFKFTTVVLRRFKVISILLSHIFLAPIP